MFQKSIILFVVAFTFVQSAKILVVTPTPSISHQLLFRSLIHELINRDHEVTFITADPMFPPGKSPRNLKEIDVHNVSYFIWNEIKYEMDKSVESDPLRTVSHNYKLLHEITHKQLTDEAVLKVIRNKTLKFDLLILEECVTPALIYSHMFEAPVILMSSFGDGRGSTGVLGGTTHPIMFPRYFQKKIYNLTVWERITTWYRHVAINWQLENVDRFTDRIFQDLFKSNTPAIKQLKSKVEMLFLNVHPIWTHNQPVPLNIMNTWGIRSRSEKKLPKDLQDYLDLSKNGVIYVSFGTNVKTSSIHPDVLNMMISVFSRLPQNILWKWNQDDLPGKSKNIKISKWFPQEDVLRHPNLKLFITQGGLQSTEEAINAAVPLIGISIFGDQHYNTEKYLYFKIGIKLQYSTLTKEKFENSIKSILEDYESYKKNIITLRTRMRDQPKPAIENVMWWIEYIIRHGGVQHLRAPSANMTMTEYYELELVILVLSALIVTLAVTVLTLYYLFKRVHSVLRVRYKIVLRIFMDKILPHY